MLRPPADHGAGLPGIDGERCVHRAAVVASCRACADACPRGAWTVDDTGVSLDAAACDGCGLCAPACPQRAIVHTHAVARRLDRGRPVALAACSTTGLANGGNGNGVDGNGRDGVEGVLPCLNVLGLGDLLDLYRSGVRRLVVADGDACADCPTGSSTAMRLERAVADLNRLLEGRGLPGLALVRRSPKPWLAYLRFDTEPMENPAGIGRRALFRMVAQRIDAAGIEGAGIDGAGTAAAPDPAVLGRRLPDPAAGWPAAAVPWPWVPSIDAGRCNGCAACARICPHGAIRLATDPPAFHLEPADCTGCRLCADVCDEDAVILERLAPQRQTVLPVVVHRCRACGVEERVPAGTATPADGFCRICRKTRRTRQLFQVLD